MAEPHLDHPGEIHWFKGQGPVPIAGPCTHGDVAQDSANIAWGPSMERYTLDRNLACVPGVDRLSGSGGDAMDATDGGEVTSLPWLDETHVWAADLYHESMATRFLALGRAFATVTSAHDGPHPAFSWADVIAGWRVDYQPPQRYTLDRWVTSVAPFAPKPKPMNPPARDLDVITRFHAHLNPGDFVLPRTSLQVEADLPTTGPAQRRRTRNHRSGSRGHW